MKINNLTLISGIFAIFLTILFLALVATAEEVNLGDGRYQEIPPNDNVNGDAVEYSGIENSDHHDVTIPEEEQQNVDDGQIDDPQGTTEDNINEEVDSDNENENVPSEQDYQEDTVQDDYQEQIISLLNNLDQTIKKLIISLWVLFGLLLGSKLIKGLFGYG